MRLQYTFILFSLRCVFSSSIKIKDKVNLQWAICDKNPQIVLEKLGKAAAEPDKVDPISYYDTKPPVYTAQGLMFRAKVRAGQNISVVKVSVTEVSDVPISAICLWDRYGDAVAFVCKMQSPINNATSIWSGEQVHFAEHFWGNIDWDELVEFGPYQNPKWKQLRIHGYKAVFDDVAVPPHHLMEIEVKVPRRRSKDAYQIITKYLENAGLVLCERQESRTIRIFRALGYLADSTIFSVDTPLHKNPEVTCT
ncbi:hypothetical protein ZTR_07933 [Talaromyces verruculosus]|nr:hypothetical protein ZTR_07933 [Talaromyces verruculosus]